MRFQVLIAVEKNTDGTEQERAKETRIESCAEEVLVFTRKQEAANCLGN